MSALPVFPTYSFYTELTDSPVAVTMLRENPETQVTRATLDSLELLVTLDVLATSVWWA